MDLSIIVVNYNVRYFLHLCLESLQAATQSFDSEIIVVDNASADGSVDMVRSNFPHVRVISNSANVGFGRACNQALEVTNGRFVLFVNPDSLLGESLLTKALAVFEEDDKIGAVGVCLLDGNGEILRESKRSIPTLWSAFTKFSGLSDIFPRTALFNGYYAPELDYNDAGDIDVLPGAFMLIRKRILDEIGGFDPRFFMYAEDVDLSYRIIRAGYRIRYVGSLHVIHFKGESTQKSEQTYTSTFFHSMRLFIQKYKGELYAPSVAWLLDKIVMIIQWIKGWRKQFIPVGSARTHSGFPHHLTILSGHPHLPGLLKQKLDIPSTEIIPDQGHGDASFYLRYAPSYLLAHPHTAVMVDVESMSFDQIVELWKLPRRQPIFILDMQHAYVISSRNKEKQGEVHTFTS